MVLCLCIFSVTRVMSTATELNVKQTDFYSGFPDDVLIAVTCYGFRNAEYRVMPTFS